MARPLYLSVYGALIGSTLVEVSLLGLPIPPLLKTPSIMGLAGLKALLIALFYQHLKDEPRALSSILIMALLIAASLITISLLSIHSM